jgi:hypothetical protein
LIQAIQYRELLMGILLVKVPKSLHFLSSSAY